MGVLHRPCGGSEHALGGREGEGGSCGPSNLAALQALTPHPATLAGVALPFFLLTTATPGGCPLCPICLEALGSHPLKGVLSPPMGALPGRKPPLRQTCSQPCSPHVAPTP